MPILILGGTKFVGRHIVEAFLAAGHGVSILTRGIMLDALPAAVERLRRDRVQEVYGSHCALLRPQIVAGPYDPSSRYTYWVNRAARGDFAIPGRSFNLMPLFIFGFQCSRGGPRG